MKKQLYALALSLSAVWLSPAWQATAWAADTLVVSARKDTLQSLIALALRNDASQAQLAAQSSALRETAVASATQMDPKLKVGVGGLPVDSFQFDEDPMTNISVGLMQQFERGDTLELLARKARQQAEGVDWQIQARQREVANSITQLWLELGYQQYAERVFRENQRLMSEMAGFIRTNYAIGKSETQDLLQAQLQVSRLDDKLQASRQTQRKLISQMSEWLGAEWLSANASLAASYQLDGAALDAVLKSHDGTRQFYPLLVQHPMVAMTDAAILASQTQADIAGEAYQPQFAVEVMYGYRQANNMRGEPASDLLSAYLTVDLPLFTDNRQDRNRAAAHYQVGAAKSQKDLLLAQMNARVNALLADRQSLAERLARYQNSLLPQAKERTQAVERGYQNNTAQFSDVINAASDELALELERARLTVDLSLTSSNLAFLLGGEALQSIAPSLLKPAPRH
ncbi:TolC family protein [Photobacterium sp. TLY01]|uniref:TolC family protein n=1 Tax=Photobacterium sp. TLY01 TaxID=2907534 RepID=UPI001F20CCEC|nr:TolC family protein [Photobacterium sp. TLY01]UIP29502.1 TolC family protein [Photobacterium sp. TLY01]